MAYVNGSKDNFEKEVLQSQIPAIVDFWASWCGPCKMFAPTFEAAAEKYAGKLAFVKVNVDDEMELAKQYKVMSIPTIMIFKDGEMQVRQSKVLSEEELDQMLKDYL